jgi:hypothetical protein
MLNFSGTIYELCVGCLTGSSLCIIHYSFTGTEIQYLANLDLELC